MTTERELIQRLADDLEGITEELVIPEYAHTEKERTDASLALVAEARALLSQSEPEGPTDEEMNDLFWKHSSEIGPSVGVGLAHEDAPALIREALARWGRPAVEPEGPTVMEIIALADEITAEELGLVDLVRRALARWGRPAIRPVPRES